MAEYLDNIVLEDARLIFRNFAGKEKRKEGRIVNPEGNRNFCIYIDDSEKAAALSNLGFSVKMFPPSNNEDGPTYYLQVTVKFDNFPPKIWMVTSENKTLLDDKTVGLLDVAEIVRADITIRPYNWSVNGNTGVKPYVKSMFVTIREDELERKYKDIPESHSEPEFDMNPPETDELPF